MLRRCYLVGLSLAVLAASSSAFAQERTLPQERKLSIDMMLSEGLSADSNGVHRGRAGGIYQMGSLAFDAQFQFEGWTRWNTERGSRALALGFGGGARYAVFGERFLGLFLTAGATYLRLVANGDELVAKGFERTLNKNVFVARAGVAYGFPAAKRTTIALRIDINKSFMSHADPIPFPAEKPDPAENPISFHIGLELIHWP